MERMGKMDKQAFETLTIEQQRVEAARKVLAMVDEGMWHPSRATYHYLDTDESLGHCGCAIGAAAMVYHILKDDNTKSWKMCGYSMSRSAAGCLNSDIPVPAACTFWTSPFVRVAEDFFMDETLTETEAMKMIYQSVIDFDGDMETVTDHLINAWEQIQNGTWTKGN